MRLQGSPRLVLNQHNTVKNHWNNYEMKNKKIKTFHLETTLPIYLLISFFQKFKSKSSMKKKTKICKPKYHVSFPNVTHVLCITCRDSESKTETMEESPCFLERNLYFLDLEFIDMGQGEKGFVVYLVMDYSHKKKKIMVLQRATSCIRLW